MDRIVTIWSNIASVGWYLLAILFSLWYISPYLKDKYLRWKRRREEEEYSAKYHRDPDLFQERLVALDACRQQMQQNYSAKAANIRKENSQYKEKKKEVVGNMEKGLDFGGVKLGRSPNDSHQDDSSQSNMPKGNKSLKSEYNPLMGDGARSYRPPKRTRCKGGGCG